MGTCKMAFWIALNLWPLVSCCDEQAATAEPKKVEQPAAVASADDSQMMQTRIAGLEARIVALEARLAVLEQTSRSVPPIYPMPIHPMPPMPGYPGWGINPMPMPMPAPAPNFGQAPSGWQIREVNGQSYYLVPINGVHNQ